MSRPLRAASFSPGHLTFSVCGSHSAIWGNIITIAMLKAIMRTKGQIER
jgi:hypothetical protein